MPAGTGPPGASAGRRQPALNASPRMIELVPTAPPPDRRRSFRVEPYATAGTRPSVPLDFTTPARMRSSRCGDRRSTERIDVASYGARSSIEHGVRRRESGSGERRASCTRIIRELAFPLELRSGCQSYRMVWRLSAGVRGAPERAPVNQWAEHGVANRPDGGNAWLLM